MLLFISSSRVRHVWAPASVPGYARVRRLLVFGRGRAEPPLH